MCALYCEANPKHNPDPQYCSEYSEAIHTFYTEHENFFQPGADYMVNQGDINEKMRSILIDWLVEVFIRCNYFRFPECRFAADLHPLGIRIRVVRPTSNPIHSAPIQPSDSLSSSSDKIITPK